MRRTAGLAMLLALALWLVGTWLLFGGVRETTRVPPPRPAEENASGGNLEAEIL